MPALLLTRCVTWGKALDLSEFHFPHLQKGENTTPLQEDLGVD